MQVIWNGTGSAWSYHFGNASAVIEAGGERLLLDCGHTVPGRLKQMGLSLQEISGVVLTHLHGDHIYGLEEWGFRNFLVWKTRPRLYIAQPLAQPLWRNVLCGTMGQHCNNRRLLRDYFEVVPMPVGQLETFGPFTLQIHPVRHIPGVPAYGVKVETEAATVAFTGDSLADADPFFYTDTDMTFHDCTFQPYFPETVHAHFEQLACYPQEWREKTFLVHYEDAVQEKRADASWQSELAATGMRLAEPFVPILPTRSASEKMTIGR